MVPEAVRIIQGLDEKPIIMGFSYQWPLGPSAFELEPRLRRLRGYRALPQLRVALKHSPTKAPRRECRYIGFD